MTHSGPPQTPNSQPPKDPKVNDHWIDDAGDVRWVLALGRAWLVRADLERSRIWTLGGGVLVVIGAVLFFIVTGSGKH